MLKGYKTYITGFVTIVGAIGAYLIQEATLAETIQLVITAVMGMTIRHGLSTETAKKLVLGFLCFGMIFAFTPRQAEAHPALMFASTAIVGGWSALTYEQCKEDGVDAKECVKSTWRDRQPLDYSKLND